MVRVDAMVPPIVSDRQEAVAVTSGCLLPVKLASPITASTVLDGTPLVQLAAVFQAVLVVPFQLVWAKEIMPVNNIRLTKNKGLSHNLFFIYWIKKQNFSIKNVRFN